MTKIRTPQILALVAAFVALAVVPSAAHARVKVAVGLGDQSPLMFEQPAYKALKLKKTRYFVRWDVMRNANDRARARDYMVAARKAKVRVLLHVSTNDFTLKKAKRPSNATYRKEMKRLVSYFKRLGVREFGVWNEANHASQPTYNSPVAAAAFFRTMRSVCKGCTLVGLDVLDQKGVERYIARFFGALPKSQRKYVKVVGIHNYSDTNRKRSTGTAKIIRAVKKYNRNADFWLTETGGVVSFGSAFPCSESRAASRTSYMFTLAKKYRRDITRLYAYNYFGTDCSTRFDAGLVRADGTPRAAYRTFKSKLSGFTR